jgi:hypothetical protein
MSNQSSTPIQPLKILKEDYSYYVIDQSQAVQALTNYHKNKRLDKYLELSQLKDVTVAGKKYTRKEWIGGTEFKVLYGIQRSLEKIISELNIIGLHGNSISKRLQEHGETMKPTELRLWRTEWTKLQKENDDLVKSLELKTDEGREKVLMYTFKIPKAVFTEHYQELLDLADGNFFTIVNLFDSEDPTRVKNVVEPLINPTSAVTTTVADSRQMTKEEKKLKGIDT